MIKGKRSLLGNFLYRSGLSHGMRSLGQKSLVIFNYHRIREQASLEHHPFDEGVFGPTAKEFRDHMKWLKGHCDMISEQDLLDHVQGKINLPRSSVMITFDDGYRDNLEIALPILNEFNIPAIFFIPTQAIEEREVGWWDKIAYVLKKSEKKNFVLRDRPFDLQLGKKHAIRELQEWMRTHSAKSTVSLLKELSEACGVDLPTSFHCDSEIMTWDQIREAQKKGITIGSHTHSHRVLSTLTLAEQFEEFHVSKKILEAKLKTPVRSVAYPVGGHDDWHLETGEIAERCGYQLGFSFQTGANRLHRVNRLEIARVPAEDTIPMTCAAVSFPSVFARSRTGERPTRSLFLSLFAAAKLANSTQPTSIK